MLYMIGRLVDFLKLLLLLFIFFFCMLLRLPPLHALLWDYNCILDSFLLFVWIMIRILICFVVKLNDNNV